MRRSRGCKTFAYPWQRRTIGGQARNRLTRFAQHRIVINGIAVHSIHFRARHSEALPLLLIRLSNAGYVVLLPDLYYRFGPYAPLVPKEVFQGDVAAILGPLMATTGVDKVRKDTESLLAYLDTRNDIAGAGFGAVGFCMGGGMAIAAAATYPHRFSAVASFHGGHLATDGPTSPHLLVPNLAAQVYIASAENDVSYPPAMAACLEDAMTRAGVRYRSEIYRNASHGWMVPDFPVYDQVSADRGWEAMLALFTQALQR